MADSTQTPLYRDNNLLILFSVTLTAVMGVSSVTPAFPAIADALQIDDSQTGWLITVYYVPGVVLTPILGILADRFGRRRVLGPSLLLFAAAGVGCSLTSTFAQLLGLRLLQGVGAAAVAALNLTLIGDLFSGTRRTQAMGYNATVLSIGTAIYPGVGGLLASIGWQVPFVLPALGFVTGLLVLTRLETQPLDRTTDLAGYFQNMVDVLHRPSVYAVFAVSFALFVLLFGPYFTYFPILAARRFEATSTTIGLLMSTVSVASGLVAAMAGRIDAVLSRRLIVGAGFAAYAGSFALFPWMDALAWLVAPAVLYGIGQGLNVPTLQTVLSEMAPREQRAAFMAANGTVNRIGQAVGPVLAGLVYGSSGFTGVFVGAAIVSCVSIVAIPFALRA